MYRNSAKLSSKEENYNSETELNTPVDRTKAQRADLLESFVAHQKLVSGVKIQFSDLYFYTQVQINHSITAEIMLKIITPQYLRFEYFFTSLYSYLNRDVFYS